MRPLWLWLALPWKRQSTWPWPPANPFPATRPLLLQVTVDVNVTFYEGKPWQAVLPHGLTTWTMSFDRCGTILKDLVRDSKSPYVSSTMSMLRHQLDQGHRAVS